MLDTAIKLITKIEENGFETYLIGGFVRDYLLGRKSSDVDIATSATPKEIREIFQGACLPGEDYGSVTVLYKNIRFEITTFRQESDYIDHRRPNKITYIKSLEEDLKRRDFTINTICMNKDKEIIDLLNGRCDLENKLVKSVLDPQEKFSSDVLRILRAIRFCTTLGFSLGEEEKEAIIQSKYLLKNLSYQRKKEELDKIFSSPNVMMGLSLIKELKLEKELELKNLNKVKPCSQMIGIWTKLEVDDIYPFSKNEKDMMKSIREILKKSPLDAYCLYQYGLYPCVVAGELCGIDKKEINEAYSALPISKQQDLDITTDEILEILNIPKGSILKKIYQGLIAGVLKGEIENTKDDLKKACVSLYHVLD